MKRQIFIPCVLVCLGLLLVSSSPGAKAANNILVIIADDLGVDMLGIYGRGRDTPPTPNIDALKVNGVLFRNAWANPLCSPTRASIQTGQYGFRTGVGYVVLEETTNGLPLADPDIRPLPRVLNQNPGLGYSHAAIGKWHLSNTLSSLSGHKVFAPNDAGWSHFSGNWSYMGGANVDNGLDNYFNWQKLQNGAQTAIGNPQDPQDPAAYVTTVNVNDAVQWIGQQTGPWLLYLAFNSPHFPYHAPPPALLNPPRDVTGSSPRTLYKSMIEAMDTEIGRLVRTVGPAVMANTTVIFLGDNGTPGTDIVIDPFDPDRSKDTLYEGGINIPLIISGADVKNPNRESLALVNTTDLYATLLDLVGLDVRNALAGAKVDSVSLKPILADTYNRSLRKYSYAERFGAPKDSGWIRALRNERFKLIRSSVDKSDPDLYTEEFFDLVSDPFEDANLLTGTALDAVQQRNLNDLHTQMDALSGGSEDWSVLGSGWLRNVVDLLLD